MPIPQFFDAILVTHIRTGWRRRRITVAVVSQSLTVWAAELKKLCLLHQERVMGAYRRRYNCLREGRRIFVCPSHSCQPSCCIAWAGAAGIPGEEVTKWIQKLLARVSISMLSFSKCVRGRLVLVSWWPLTCSALTSMGRTWMTVQTATTRSYSSWFVLGVGRNLDTGS